MNQKRFLMLITNREDACRAILDKKGQIYAAANDRLFNFKSTGAMNEESPQEALWGMVSKHIIATRDMVKSSNTPSKQWIQEYLGDIHNYLYLLEAIWLDALELPDQDISK
jgi:hypothetical protein